MTLTTIPITHFSRLFLVFILSAAGFGGGFVQAQGDIPAQVLAYADMVLYNGKILTADEGFTVARAVAVRDGKILAIGDTDLILKMAGPKTTRINLEGKTVTPGFIDVHSNGAQGSHGPSGPNWFPYYTQIRFDKVDDGLRMIKAAVEKAPPGEWVFVNPFRTAAAYQLTQEMLDQIAPNHLLLVNLDNAIGLMNSKALSYIPDDAKSGLFRDKDGKPTGKIGGFAYGVLTYEILPYPQGEWLEEMIQKEKRRVAAIHRMGVTSLGARMSGLALTIVRELQRRGDVPMRIRVSTEMSRLNPHTERYLKRMGNLNGVGNEWFKISGMAFGAMDSTAGNAGHWTRTPMRNTEPWYAYGPYGHDKWKESAAGAENWQENSDYRNAYLAGKYGWNMTDVHAQGDGAVELALEIWDKINKETPIRGKAFGIVHGTMRPPDLAKRLAGYDAVLSMAPDYLFRGPRNVEYLEKQYGADAVAGYSPLRDLIDVGLKPVLEVTNTGVMREELDGQPTPDTKLLDNPALYMEAMEVFVTRKNLTTGKVWGQGQRIGRDEALKMATAWAARFYNDGEVMGTIEPGKLADLVILGGDYMTVPEEQISDLPVLKVVVGGKVTYEKPAN
ncbi:MAG: amidohydrolase family protein [Acidobacteria bacterium]|nr:amidohydrolase family protein [Acidobacteriota bacterium]